MADLTKLYDWYQSNQSKLIEEYNGNYIVISNNAVVGVYENEDKAYSESVAKYGLGNFLIQFCTNDQSEIMQTYHSRVYF